MSRGRVLVQTLREQGDQGPIYVLALDTTSAEEVKTWADLNVITVSVDAVESDYPQLLEARADRSRMEYLFTLTPWLTRWVLDRALPCTWVTYLDADMAFFAPTDALYSAAAESSVMIVEHRFTWEQTWRQRYGRFNVGWVGFRNDDNGRACLNWWATSCLNWCFDEVSKGRFADQGYLNQFPSFPGVFRLEHPGADLAPWNLRRHRLDSNAAGSIFVDGEPLVFFHFHGLRKIDGRYHFKHLPYLARTTSIVRDLVYRPYCERLEFAERYIGTRANEILARRPTLASALRSRRSGLLRWLGERRGDYVDVDRT